MASSEKEVTGALKEILPFLDVLTPEDYKSQILEHVLGMTGTKDGVQCIAKSKKLLECLVDLIQFDKSDKVRLQCFKVTVNLSSTCADVGKSLLDPDFIYYLLNVVVHQELDCCDLAAMLLSNITQHHDNCEIVATKLMEHDSVTMEKLTHAFCTAGYNKNCELHHLGSFLSNLTLRKELRILLLKENLIGRILPFTTYEGSTVRRFSAASIIKNCLFETEYHEWLLNDVDIVPHLLLPLAGPEEFDEEEMEKLPIDLQYLPPDKARESSKEIQDLLIESLFQLCATKSCRLIMKDNGVYYIMRELHKIIEEDDPIMMSVENLVQVLIGDEPDEQFDKDNLREIEIPKYIEDKMK